MVGERNGAVVVARVVGRQLGEVVARRPDGEILLLKYETARCEPRLEHGYLTLVEWSRKAPHRGESSLTSCLCRQVGGSAACAVLGYLGEV